MKSIFQKLLLLECVIPKRILGAGKQIQGNSYPEAYPVSLLPIDLVEYRE